jgi:hypothetical protein
MYSEYYISYHVTELAKRNKEIKEMEGCILQSTQILSDTQKQLGNGMGTGHLVGVIYQIQQQMDANKKTLELKKQDLIKYIKCHEEFGQANLERAKLEQEQRELQARILKRKEQEKQDELAKRERMKSMSEKERHIARIKDMDPTEKRKEYDKMCQEREETKIEYILMYGFEKWEAFERQEKQKVFTGWE